MERDKRNGNGDVVLDLGYQRLLQVDPMAWGRQPFGATDETVLSLALDQF